MTRSVDLGLVPRRLSLWSVGFSFTSYFLFAHPFRQIFKDLFTFFYKIMSSYDCIWVCAQDCRCLMHLDLELRAFVNHLMWVLRSELRSSVRAASTLYPRAFLPCSPCLLSLFCLHRLTTVESSMKLNSVPWWTVLSDGEAKTPRKLAMFVMYG